jgi:hypothetical protein
MFPERSPSAGREDGTRVEGVACGIGAGGRVSAGVKAVFTGGMFSARLDRGGETISMSVRSMIGETGRLSYILMMGDVEHPTSYWPPSIISGEFPRLYLPNGDLDLLSTLSRDGERERERRRRPVRTDLLKRLAKSGPCGRVSR